MSNKLDAYLQVVEFLGKALGQQYEIVLHDLTTPDHSIIAIANGSLSGRVVGGPATDFALKMMKQGDESNRQYIVNYRARNVNGHLFRSASHFIRNEKGKLIGMLCINFNVTLFINLRDQLTQDIICDNEHPTNEVGMEEQIGNPLHVFENFQGSIEDVITSMIDNALSIYSVSADRLSANERISVVEELNEGGLFLLKGGLAALAERLQVSEPTIYRYLSKVKRRSE